MTKKNIKILLFISLFLIVGSVDAACDYQTQVQIATEASNVKINYEADWYGTGVYEDSEVSDEQYEITEPGVKINIYNITENIYVKMTNLNTREVSRYTHNDLINGSITLEFDANEIREFEFVVYSNHADCKDEEYRKIPLTLPKYNSYSDQFYCTDVKEYYCQEFITQEINMTEEKVMEEAYKTQQTQKNNENNPTVNITENFWQKYGLYLIIGILIIGVVTIVIVIKKQRSKVL